MPREENHIDRGRVGPYHTAPCPAKPAGCSANSERIQQYESYLRTNLHGIHGARRLRAALSPQARSAAVDGSGAVEKQGDLLVARRFEHAGMRWTKAGANRLLKLRIQELARSA